MQRLPARCTRCIAGPMMVRIPMMQKHRKSSKSTESGKTRKAELAWKLQARNLQACKAASLKISKLEEIKGEDAAPPRQMHQVHCRPYDGEDTDDAKTQKKQQKHRKRQNTKSRVSVEAASAESASVQGC